MEPIKVLKNIKPFNEFFFKNCFFDSFFPVIGYYNKSIMPFLINNIAIYKGECKNGRVCLDAEYLSCMDDAEIMFNMGINCLTVTTGENLIGNIKKSISNGRPVIIWVDCYYEPIRPDAYLKLHWPHTWLLYGYDDHESLCNIIEHGQRESLSYKERTLCYQDVLNCYHGYLANFQRKEEPAYYEFQSGTNRINCSELERDNMGEYTAVFSSNMKSKKDIILNSLKFLEPFLADFADVVQNREALFANAEQLLGGFNNIINCKNVEQHKLIKICGRGSGITGLLDEILETWKFIRARMVKFIYTSVYDPDTFNFLPSKLDSIIKLENRFYTEVFNFIGKL